jgi:hypothetical protein
MFTSKKNMAMASLNAAVFVLGFSIVSFYPSGMWSSGTELYSGSGGKVFSCDNNWSPVSAILKNDA